jgi:hypothetical protein
MKRKGIFFTATTAIVLTVLTYSAYVALAATSQFWNTNGTSNTWTAANWGTTAAGPFTTGWTNNNDANFTANSAITFVTNTQVGNINVTNGSTVTMTPAGTFSTNGNVRTFDVGTGSILDFGSQSISTVAGTGFIKNGAGTYFTSNGNAYTGGFTLNNGTIILGGINAMGAGGPLTINGGTLAANATRTFTGKFTSFTIGGDFTMGAVTTGVPSGNATNAANISIDTNASLGAATRTITIGSNATYTLGGIISGSAGSGLTVANASGATGTLSLNGANNYTGDTTISGGKLSLGTTGSIANSPNIILAGGSTFDVTGLTTALTLASGQGLKGSGTTITGTINTSATKGLTTAANSPIQFTAFSGAAAPLTVGGAGTLTLASGNPVTVNVSNGGTPLGVGTYTLIAKGASGSVAGTAPTSLTVNGDGLAPNTVASLSITGAQLVMNVVSTTGKYRSKQSGNWNDFNTWQTDTGSGFVDAVSGQTPTSAADTIEIQNTHTVTVTASVNADQLTVDSGGTLSVNNGVTFTIADGAGTDLTDNGTVATAGNITNNGQAVINNKLQINEGGFPGGGTGTYSYDQTNGVLVFNNSTGPFGVNNNNYWPTTNGPQNVTVQNTGGITMNVARTVGSLFQYAANVNGAGNLTLNGTSQVNTGGSVSGSPTYGSSSLLKYNTGGTYGRNGEWLAVTSGAGYPANVQVSNNTTLDIANGSTFNTAPSQMSGNLTIDSGSTLTMSAMTQSLAVIGNVTNNGTLALSTAAGGDLHTQGAISNGGTLTHNNRTVFFEGGNTQSVSDSVHIVNGSFTLTVPYVRINKSGGSVRMLTGLNVLGDAGGDSIQFANSTSTLTLNGQPLTLGSTVGAAPAGAGFIGDPTGSQLSLQDGGTTGAMGTITFVSGSQQVSTLTVNRTGASGSVTFNTNLLVNSALNLTNGTVNMGANTLTVSTSGARTRTNGYIIGTEQKNFINTTSFTFDVGTANGYTPVDANSTAATGTGSLSVKPTQTKQPNITGTNALSRYWTLAGSNINTNLTFHYLGSDVVGTESNYQVIKYNGTFSTPPNQSVNTVAHTATVNSVSSFSDWTLADPASVFPVLGNYNNAAVTIGGNTTVTPDAAPTNTTSTTVSTSTDFKGVLTVAPATGVVSITDAQPAGAYTVTVKATGASGTTTKTFTLTVQSGTACTGTTSFTNASNILVGNSSFYAAVGDFDGDGNQDLLDSNSNGVSIRMGDGAGNFSGTTDVSVGSGPKWIAVGDFNNDGKQDFAVANSTGNTVSVRLGVGDGTFTNAADISTGIATRPWAIAAGDFNGDGKQDLAITEAFQSRVEIRLGDGAGGFTFSNYVTVGTDFTGATSANGPSSIAIGDFNEDGKQDLAVGNRNLGSTTFVPTVSIRLGVGDGTFTGTSEVAGGALTSDLISLALGDFNGDGHQDFVTVTSQTSTLNVRLGDGAGNFSGTTAVSTGANTFPLSVAVADFNNDGKQDLLGATSNVSSAALALGDGAGNFGTASTLSLGSAPQAVAAGDFNEDGKLDFVAPGNSNLAFIRLNTCVVAQPGAIQFSSATYSDSETNADHTFSATVTRTGGTSGAVSVSYSVTDGTATVAGNDYTVANATGTLNWADGDSSAKTIDITVKGDLNIEPDETVNFAISNPQGGASLGTPASAVLTITNDDAETAISPSGGNLTITDGNGGTSADALTISVNGSNLRIHDPNNTLAAGPGATQVDPNTVDIPLSSVTGQIQVNTGGGNDTLTLDFTGGSVIPAGGIAYNGGTQTSVPPGDTLALVGGNQGTVTYNYTNANDGSVTMSNYGTVTYTGLEPITDTGTAGNIVFNLPAGPTAATLGDDGTPGNTLSRLSGATFETTDFANPTGSLTINRGNSADTIAVNALPDFNASLTIGSGANPFSTINFGGAVTLAANKNLSGDATGTINLSTASSDLATSGTGTVALTTARDITLATGSSINVDGGGLTLSANAAGTTTGAFTGILLNNASLTTTGAGVISLTGKGGSNASSNLRGITLSGGATVSSTLASGGGTITLNGTGGQGVSSNNGVELIGSPTTVTSVSGDITITGQGGAGTGSNNFGVQVEQGAVVSSTGAAKINIGGTGGTSPLASARGIGVRIAFDTTQVTSSGGDITITGQGANGGAGNFGVSVAFGGLVNATGGAKININGTAGTGTGSLSGVIVSNFDSGTNAPSRVTSNSGDISITGIAGNGTGNGNIGINTDTTAKITATGSAGITLNGTGGNGTSDCYGVGFEGGGANGTGISSVNGNISITGTGGTTAGTDMDGVRFEDSVGVQPALATTTGTGTLTITGTAGNNDPTSAGINIVNNTTMSLTGATNTFIADTMDFGTSNTSVSAGSNALTLRQKTNGIAINLGGADSATQLGLTDTELDIINAGTINIGNANTGAITVSANITRAAATVLNLTSGANIDVATGSLNSAGGNITLTPNTNVFPSNSGVDVTTGAASTLTLASAKDLKIVINNTTVDTGYTQLNVAGLVNLNVANLALSGALVPSGGQQFVIVNNDGADAVTGTFNGLAEGATIPNFLGSPLNAKITYVGGDGNDVVLSVQTPPKYRSKQSGNWNDFNTWQVDTGGGFVNATAGQTPTSADDTIEIQSTHTVTVTASVDADQLTVDSGGTISVNNGVTFTIADGAGTDLTDNGTVATAGNITDNGQAQINNILQINEGGFPGSGTGTYSYDQTNGVLVFNNSTGPFGVNNNNYWPTTNGPQNVTVQNTGGIQMNVARTVGLLFQYAKGVSGAGNLTLNGTSQVNNGGFMSGSPTYGPSSLLKYNVNASYGRNGEWLPNVTSGAGYPNNVQLSNNTNLDLPNGSSNVFFQLAGNLTIDSGSTMNLNGSPAMTQPLNVTGNVQINGTLTLSSASGGDTKVGGNWTRTGTFNPNGRAVTFNGAGTQTIARASAGQIETFDYLVVDKSSGNLTQSSAPATSVIIASPGGGSALQIINAGGIDLGASNNGLTLNGSVAGTNILVGGAAAPATRTITGTGTFAVTGGDKSVTSNNSKTITFDTGVNVSLFKGMDFGALLSTVNGTLTIGSGGFVANNPPTYGPASTLLYDCTCVFSRSAEWTSATSGPGAPNNVTVNTNTDLDLGSTTPGTALQAAGNLTANNGGRVLMSLDDNSHAMTSALTVLKDVTVNTGGTLRLSSASGGDLHLQGHFANGGTFTPNNRAVFFEGGNLQNVSDSTSFLLTMPYVRINKSGGTVRMLTGWTILGPAGGDSIQFTGATSTITLNGQPLTLGSTVGTPPAGSGIIGDPLGSQLSLQDGGTGPGGPMGTIAFTGGASGQQVSILTINRTGANASATLGSDLFVNSTLNLTSGDIITGANTLTMGDSASSTGVGDVVGNVKRTNFTNGAHATNKKSFGNPNVQISFQTGTPASDVTVNLVKSRPTGNGFGFPTAVNRTYTVTQNGASGFTATFRMHYVDSDLTGNPPLTEESLLDLWRFNGTTWSRVNKTGADILTANNKWVESSLVTQFSPWTLAAQPLAPTAARLRELRATASRDGILVEWRTGYEVDNLGFRLYRDDGAGRVPVTPSLVAGSALTAGPGTVLGAGNSYAWLDPNGTRSSTYYLEDINTDGQSNVSGPFYTSGPAPGRMPNPRQAVPLGKLGVGASAQSWQHQWWPTTAAVVAANGTDAVVNPQKKTSAQAKRAAAQASALADGPAVKLLVRRAGWYRATRAQLEAAGLSPSADPARLQLFVDGVEQAIRVNSDNWQANGSIEFYGEGLDKPTTDTRIYWLVEGQTAGRRMTSQQSATQNSSGGRSAGAPGGGASGSTEHVVPGVTIDPPDDSGPSFTYTTELKERSIYFSSLLNGDTENFFGRVVSSTTGAQTIVVSNLGGGSAGGGEVGQASLDGATLEVALQGVTAGAHSVGVSINGQQVGTIEFEGRAHQIAGFGLESGVLHEGDNQVQLTSSSASDVSLTDYIRVTYQHKLRADDDALRFTANAGTSVSVSGFHSGIVRVVDITDPNNVSELQGGEINFDVGSGESSINVQVSGTGTRTLLAFADSRVAPVDGALAHSPAGLRDSSNEADFVIITHPTFAGSVALLADARRAEGLSTKVVSINDVFDEFSAGEHSPQAVKDFLAWTASHWKRAPRYVLLVGDGSYDPRDYFGRGSADLVPAKLVDTAHMETASDSWYADFNGDGIAEMAVGRLPVRTVGEANTVIAKILGYAPADPARQSALLVADRAGADGYSFESATDGVQSLLPSDVGVQRINRGAQTGDAVRAQIVEGINAGPSVVNWMGHGSINVWTGDGLLRNDDAPSLTNRQHLSLFVMMTCLNGYFQDPSLDGLAESLLKAQNGGAIAAWSSTGMTEPDGQAAMNAELYRALYAGAGPLRLGDAMQRARTATTDTDVLRTWVLIGDPTTRWR